MLLSAFLATRKLDAKIVRYVVAASFLLFGGFSLHDGLTSMASSDDSIYSDADYHNGVHIG